MRTISPLAQTTTQPKYLVDYQAVSALHISDQHLLAVAQGGARFTGEQDEHIWNCEECEDLFRISTDSMIDSALPTNVVRMFHQNRTLARSHQ
jgi:hypothetical protein